MSFYKLNTPPGNVWPELPLPQFTTLWSAYQELNKSQWLTLEDIQVAQLKQINIMLRHCASNVPYYKGKIPSYVRTIADFKKLPFLTRELYHSNSKYIKAANLPTGLQMSEKPLYTSGTNGVPIAVYKTNNDALWWQALAMRDFEWNQMNPMSKIAAIRLIAMKPEEMDKAMKGVLSPGWFPPVNGATMFKSSPSYAMDIRQDPHKQIDWLKAVNPNYLISLPSNLDVLASILQDEKIKLPSIKIIQVIGEPITPEIQNRIELAFDAKIVNLYSTNECGYIASTCPSGEGLHVHSENVYVEVLNENNEDCKPGETGRLVFTSLTNFANPFIRYDILDDVTLADKPCSCGRGLPLWKHVEGRRHPMLFLANGKRKASTGLMLGIRQIGGFHQFQVIQHDIDKFTVRVVPSREWTQEHELKIIKYVQDEVNSPVHVDIKKEASIPRPNGKLKIIVVELEQNNAK